MHSTLIRKYKEIFSKEPQFFVSSSGRVNLIGEHVDYHDGIVLPCAISLKNNFVGGPSEDYEAIGINISNRSEFRADIKGLNIYEKGSSSSYLYGVCRSVIDAGHFIKGINFVVDGDLPIGSGLSSSASFCCGLIELLSQIYKLNLGKMEIAKIARMAENNYVGVPCGIMDQMAIAFGKEKKLVKIDCRDLSVNYCSMPNNISIVIVNTMLKRQLAKSEYENRQRECSLLLSILRRYYPYIKSLRDVNSNMLNTIKNEVDEIIFKRGKYVLDEIQRVEAVFEMMNSNNIKDIGKIFYEGHIGLRDEYEVSCDELDFIVEETYKFEGAIAARMTGAGFGGCAVTLIRNGFEENFSNYIRSRYMSAFKRDCDVYIIGQPVDGLISIRL
ncbi:MAG: galactokinase [Deltaproteobacteria bacterium]|nr:galactokinase [Deltaproteobacteria bacterium]